MAETPLGYSEENGIVTIRMTRDDWDQVLWNLGRAAGIDYCGDAKNLRPHFALLNRLEAGNPSYKPYEIPEETSA